MSKPMEISKLTYKPGAATIKAALLPERLPYMPADWKVDSMEIRAAGTMSDGREFQDVRIYIKEA